MMRERFVYHGPRRTVRRALMMQIIKRVTSIRVVLRNLMKAGVQLIADIRRCGRMMLGKCLRLHGDSTPRTGSESPMRLAIRTVRSSTDVVLTRPFRLNTKRTALETMYPREAGLRGK